MFTQYWRCSIVWTLAQLFLIPAGAAPVTVGVALPQGQPLQSADVAEPMRQSLISQLKAQSIDAVPLTAASDTLVDAEAQAKHCSYVLYTHLEKHGSSSLRGKMSGLGSLLSLTAFSQKGANSIATAMTQGAANTVAASAQQQGMSQLTGTAVAGVKQGDTMTMAYRLMSVGSTNPVKTASFDSAKAGGDGQDIVSPLLAQVAGAVGAATAANAKPPGSLNTSMDCAKIASMPNAPMSVEACEKLQASQQTYAQAAADPSASRPGDDQMTCPQITAELKQQQYTAPDKTKVAEAGATIKQQQDIQKREYANMVKMQAEDQTAVAAATAADTATELATGGLVRGRALEAVDKSLTAKHDANNERVIKEDLPVTQTMVSQTAGLGADFAQQLQSNPRLARLMQLADSKHCKGGT